MADDIVIQLRQLAASMKRGQGMSTVYGAANEIELLRTEVERLTADNARLGFMLHPLGTTTQIKTIRHD